MGWSGYRMVRFSGLPAGGEEEGWPTSDNLQSLLVTSPHRPLGTAELEADCITLLSTGTRPDSQQTSCPLYCHIVCSLVMDGLTLGSRVRGNRHCKGSLVCVCVGVGWGEGEGGAVSFHCPHGS